MSSVKTLINVKKLLILSTFSNFAWASLPTGEIHYLKTPNGTEQCIIHNKMPNAKYSEKDLNTEKNYCGLDFYADNIALCPKLDSTSPGTFIFSLEGTGMNRVQAEKVCGVLESKAKKISNFKVTMNQSGTSACNSNGSIMAYHFARYFNTNILVPPAVFRTFDKTEHYKRVAKGATGKGEMIKAAWQWVRTAETKTESYSEKSLLFTPDLTQVVGSMYKLGGERYPSYFNGVREKDQYIEFLQTPPYRALSSEESLSKAIDVGLSVAKKSSQFAKELAFGPTREQMVMWMQDLVEIAVMGVIFSEQDRVGNIDYLWAWAYKDGDKIKYKTVSDEFKELSRSKMAIKKLVPPTEIASMNPMLVQRTVVKDNDAGGLARYLNRADGRNGKRLQTAEENAKGITMRDGKSLQTLENKAERNYINKIRHINSNFYTKLQKLSSDMQTKGSTYVYLKDTFGLAEKDFNYLISNITSVAAQLHQLCVSKKLNFDLDHEYFFTTGGQVRVDQTSCDAQ
jgi:hypothetical protein